MDTRRRQSAKKLIGIQLTEISDRVRSLFLPRSQLFCGTFPDRNRFSRRNFSDLNENKCFFLKLTNVTGKNFELTKYNYESFVLLNHIILLQEIERNKKINIIYSYTK